MNVREVMTPNPRVVTAHESIQIAARIMRDEDTGVVPVVEKGNHLLGVVTDRDIVVRAVAEGALPTGAVTEFLSVGIIVATPEMTTKEAAELMARHQVRRLPVIEGGALVGIVSLGDLAVKEGKDGRVGDTLEDISEGVKTRH